MRVHSLAHLGDAALLRNLAALVARDRSITAALLAHIAEVDARKLYLPAGYTSMHAYCVDGLGLSDDAAYKRIQSARAARQFPVLFDLVANGRLHLAAVCLLAPHLTAENVSELVEAASGRRKSEIERWLARRFERADAPAIATMLRALPARPARAPGPVAAAAQLAPGQVGPPADAPSLFGQPNAEGEDVLLPDSSSLAPGQVATPPRESPAPEPPQPAERFLLRLEISGPTHDKLRRAQELLGHSVPSNDVAAVLDRALTLLVEQLERKKFGATKSQRAARPATNPRTIPAQAKREIVARDEERCTFVNDQGHRCGAKRRLEYDHVEPVARGGTSTTAGLRLLCRAHNQFEAERVFGREFMARKREERPRSADIASPEAVP